MRDLALFVLFIVHVSHSYAGSGNGKVDTIWITTDSNVVAFTLETAIDNSPRCNERAQFAFDTAKPGGENLLQTLLRAKENDLKVEVIGRNICQSHWKSEDVHALMVK